MRKLVFLLILLAPFVSEAQEKESLKSIANRVRFNIKSGDLEEAWRLAELGEDRSKKKEFVDTLIQFMLLKSVIEDEKGNNLESVKLGLAVVDILDKYELPPKLKAQTLLRLASSYKYLQEFERGLFYLKKAERIIENNSSCSDLHGKLLVNFGATYIHGKKLDSAEIYLIDKVKKLTKTIKEDNSFKADLNYWLSRLYEEKREFDKAIAHLKITTSIDSLNGSESHYFEDRFQLAVILQGKSDWQDAVEVYEQCLENASTNGELRAIHSCQKGLYDCFLAMGDSIMALRYLIRSQATSDSLNVINEQSEVRRLEIGHQLEIFELKKQHELERLTAEKEKSSLVTWITITTSALVIGLLLFIGIFLWKRSRSRLMFKKKEIAIYTAEISSKNEAINNAVESLNAQISQVGDNKELKSTLNELKFELKNEDFWKDFEVRFRDVQAKFYRSLLQKHPNLTKNEVRLCSFVKLQLTTKEIAALTKKSIGSVNVAKHRLKKKLELPENQTLYSYINSELFL